MTVHESEGPTEPAELSKLKSFGTAARAAALPAPPVRPQVVRELVARAEPAVTTAAVPGELDRSGEPSHPEEGREPVAPTPAPSPPPVPDDLLSALIAAPRLAVVSTDPARRFSPKRGMGTYLADDALRTLQFMAYTEGCETWRLLDTAVRAIAQARGIVVRPYADEEIGKR